MIFLSLVIKKSFVTFLGFSDSQFEAVNVFSAWAADHNIKIKLPRIDDFNHTDNVGLDTSHPTLKTPGFKHQQSFLFETEHEATTVKMVILSYSPDKKDDGPEWVEGFAVEWIESEKGWGTRPDGTSIHLTTNSIIALDNTYGTGIPKAVVPTCYSYIGDKLSILIHRDLATELKEEPTKSYFWYDSTMHTIVRDEQLSRVVIKAKEQK